MNTKQFIAACFAVAFIGIVFGFASGTYAGQVDEELELLEQQDMNVLEFQEPISKQRLPDRYDHMSPEAMGIRGTEPMRGFQGRTSGTNKVVCPKTGGMILHQNSRIYNVRNTKACMKYYMRITVKQSSPYYNNAEWHQPWQELDPMEFRNGSLKKTRRINLPWKPSNGARTTAIHEFMCRSFLINKGVWKNVKINGGERCTVVPGCGTRIDDGSGGGD